MEDTRYSIRQRTASVQRIGCGPGPRICLFGNCASGFPFPPLILQDTEWCGSSLGQDRLTQPHPPSTFEFAQAAAKTACVLFSTTLLARCVRFAKSLFLAAQAGVARRNVSSKLFFSMQTTL